MVPAAAALAAGIFAAGALRVPMLAAAAVSLGCVAAGAFLYRRGVRTPVPAFAALLFLGVALGSAERRVCDFGVSRATYRLSVGGRMSRRGKWHSCDGMVDRRRTGDGTWRRCRARVRIFADTALHLMSADRLVWSGRIVPFAAEDGGYARMMIRRGYAGTVFVSARDTLLSERGAGRELFPSLRRAAAERIGRLPLTDGCRALSEAMGIGETSRLDRGTRALYASAGAAHVLALSGLHVGIVFLLVNAALWWMPLLCEGHRLRDIMTAVLIWGYVAMTGAPPSAVRAALMFSFLQFAGFASAEYSGMNALAAAAFVSLCLDPELLYDLGFGLSYVAVAGILVWGVPLGRRLRLHRDRRRRDVAGRLRNAAVSLSNLLTGTFAVGFAASVATAPLVAHIFGRIPVAGLVANPATVLLATAVVALTVVWTVAPIGAAAPVFGYALELSAGALDAVAEWAAGFGNLSLEIRPGGWTTAAVYAAMTAYTTYFRTFGRRSAEIGKKS